MHLDGLILTTDIFPSYVLEPKKTLENITWFLNPLEEPPQKILQLQAYQLKTNIYTELLEKDGFIIKNAKIQDLISSKGSNNNKFAKDFQESYFNIIFSLANEIIEDFEDFKTLIQIVHNLLRPSSYFIYEIKIDQNLDVIREILLDNFESVNFLTPWSEMKTNPFSPFNKESSNYCWIAALSQNSYEDPAEWMNEL